MTVEAGAQYRPDLTPEKLRYEFPEDPEGAAIYVVRFADRISLD
jgi:hypothetical protein